MLLKLLLLLRQLPVLLSRARVHPDDVLAQLVLALELLAAVVAHELPVVGVSVEK